jgi:formate dehydrogenase subunit gamma
VPDAARPSDRTTAATARTPTQILRFRTSERQLHWAIAVPFMVCLSTALVLVTVYNPAPGRPFRWVFSWTHRASGVCLSVLPLWTAARHRGDLGLYLRNVQEAWTWALDDVRWLMLMGPATVNKGIALPHQGKFNAAEKINFMLLTATYPMYVVTGVLIWLPGAAYLSWLVHVMMAFGAVPLIGGHIFMATVNPDTRVGLTGMTTGWVDREWARHHYRRWYDEHFGLREAAAAPVAKPIAPPVAKPTAAPAAEPAAAQVTVPVPVATASTVAPASVPNLALIEPPSDGGDDTVAA